MLVIIKNTRVEQDRNGSGLWRLRVQVHNKKLWESSNFIYSSKLLALEDKFLFQYSVGWRPSFYIPDAVTNGKPLSIMWDSVPGSIWDDLRDTLKNGQEGLPVILGNKKRHSNLNVIKS